MKNILLNMLSILAGILLAITIIKFQTTQAKRYGETLTQEEHWQLQQQYEECVEILERR